MSPAAGPTPCTGSGAGEGGRRRDWGSRGVVPLTKRGLGSASPRKDADPSAYRIHAGNVYLYGGRTLLNVSRVIVHPDYIAAFLGFDLALLKLATPVRMSSRTRPVTLPLQSLDFSPEDECWLTGWGRGFYFGENAWGGRVPEGSRQVPDLS